MPKAPKPKANNKKKKQKLKKPKTKEDVEDDFVNPQDAPVPRPGLPKLTPMTSGRHSARMSEAQERRIVREARHSAKMWLEHSPTFYVKGVTLPELVARGKNIKSDVAKAKATIKAMETNGAKPDACSAKFVDELGNILACVFANRLTPEKPEKNGALAKDTEADLPQAYPGSNGRTLEDVERALDDFNRALKEFEKGVKDGESIKPKKNIYYDGLPELSLKRYHEAVQDLHADLPPLANKRDIRHPKEMTMEYTVEIGPEAGEWVREGVVQSDPIVRHERTGVTHLVHAWHQQGRPNGYMTMSKDMAGRLTTTAALAVPSYYQASRPVALYLNKLFKVAFPEYYKKYKPAFKAGQWIKEDPGPWLGRALVWKLQVDVHVDGLDEGPTAIFNLGSYTGGVLYLPDLGLKLRQGDVVIFLSGRLYHSVSEWKPAPPEKGSPLTPGRISNVFFFPKASYEVLKDKPPKWMRHTKGGRSFDARESKV